VGRWGVRRRLHDGDTHIMGVHRLRDLRVIYLVALGLSLPPRQLLLQGRRRLLRRPLRVRRGRLRGVLSK